MELNKLIKDLEELRFEYKLWEWFNYGAAEGERKNEQFYMWLNNCMTVEQFLGSLSSLMWTTYW